MRLTVFLGRSNEGRGNKQSAETAFGAMRTWTDDTADKDRKEADDTIKGLVDTVHKQNNPTQPQNDSHNFG